MHKVVVPLCMLLFICIKHVNKNRESETQIRKMMKKKWPGNEGSNSCSNHSRRKKYIHKEKEEKAKRKKKRRNSLRLIPPPGHFRDLISPALKSHPIEKKDERSADEEDGE